MNLSVSKKFPCCKIHSKIPDAVLIKIFEYLTPMERIQMEEICQECEILSKKYSWFNYKYLDLGYINPVTTSTYYLEEILRRSGKHVKSAKIAVFPFDELISLTLMDYCTNLEYLDLSLTEDVFRFDHIDEASTAFFGVLSRITTLHMFQNNSNFTGSTIHVWPLNLKVLKLGNCPRLEHQAIRVRNYFYIKLLYICVTT